MSASLPNPKIISTAASVTSSAAVDITGTVVGAAGNVTVAAFYNVISGGTLLTSGTLDLSGVARGAITATSGVLRSPAVEGEGILLSGTGAVLDNAGVVSVTAAQVVYSYLPGFSLPPFYTLPAHLDGVVSGGPGVLVTSLGTVINLVGGTLAGVEAGVALSASASIANAGLIEGLNLGTVDLQDETITGDNTASALYTATLAQGDGVVIIGDVSLSLSNTGSITGQDGLGQAARIPGLAETVSLYNAVSGVLSGANAGVYMYSGVLSLTNAGSIGGATGVSAFNATITNAAGGVISGDSVGVAQTGLIPTALFTLDNAGTITATGTAVALTWGTLENTGLIDGSGENVGVQLAGGVLYNNGGTIAGNDVGVVGTSDSGTYATIANTGLISGKYDGVEIYHGGTLVNEAGGTILATLVRGEFAVSGIGVQLQAGQFDNQGGTISSAGYGLVVGSLASALNTGVIIGTGSVGDVVLAAGGTFINSGTLQGRIGALVSGTATTSFENSGVITGRYLGVSYSGNGGSGIVNTGTITGVALFNTGTIVNTGLIQGLRDGVYTNCGISTDREDIYNAGTINGGTYAITTRASLNLTVAVGAVFGGAVTDLSDNASLTLAAGGGTLDMGGSFAGFTSISFAPGAAWTLEGTAAELAGGQTISGFGAGDTIVLEGISASSFSQSGTTLVLGGETLDLAVPITLSASADATTLSAPCFCPGTRLRTAPGDVPVEALRVGDVLHTMHAGLQPVRWIGCRSYDGRFIAGHHLMLPVTVKAGALAEGVPARDLHISPGHALYVGGLLIPAWRLVNGVSITQAKAVDRVTYYHVELPRHEVIYAEACPAESFYEDACRAQFQASQGEPATTMTPRPRCESGPALEVLRRALAARAGMAPPATVLGALRGYIDIIDATQVIGWAQDEAAPETPVSLVVEIDGVAVAHILANAYRADLRAAGLGSGCHGFALPLPRAGAVTVRRTADGAVLPPTDRAQAA